MRFAQKAVIILILALPVATTVGATGIDLHRLWDSRCVECHGHAGEFARAFLTVSGNELQGKHHVHDLRRFMHNHYLADSEVDAVYDMLLAQAGTQDRFRNECSSCHESAATLVRKSLIFHDGVLGNRDSGRTVRSFLEHHRGLTPSDVDFYVTLLNRVASEIYRP